MYAIRFRCIGSIVIVEIQTLTLVGIMLVEDPEVMVLPVAWVEVVVEWVAALEMPSVGMLKNTLETSAILVNAYNILNWAFFIYLI